MRSLLVALCLTLGLSAGLSAAEGKFPDISHTDLVSAIQAKNVVVIDVNGTDSFTESHVDGAIDFEAAKADLASKLPADKGALIVAYCGGPACTAWKQAAKVVADLGYTNVKHYSEGISGWNEHAKAKDAAAAPSSM